MDESAWQVGARLWEMLPLVENRLSDRKRRLFAVACCKRFLHLLDDERSRNALEVAERYADDLASEEERMLAEDAAVDAHILMRESRFTAHPQQVPWSRQAELLTQAAVLAVSPGVYYAGDAADYGRLSMAASGLGLAEQSEEVVQCRLLLDIVGPLCTSVRMNPIWLARNDRAAVQVARWIYENRVFGDLPILADALEEAGCVEEMILDHCRGKNSARAEHEPEHTRGCWVLDLVLGLE